MQRDDEQSRCYGNTPVVLKKALNVWLPYDSAISVLGIYTKEMKTYSYTKMCP